MKKYLLFIGFLCFFNAANAQGEIDTISGIVAFGVGDNEADALHNAIVNAINQVFGSYITTKSEIVNDSIIFEKFSSISNGNVQRYSIVRSEKTGNGHIVTIRATVNLKNAIEFCKSIGIEAEVQGGVLADNLSIKLKNIETEKRVFETFSSIFRNEIPNIFSYNISVEDPVKASNTNDFLTKISSKIEMNQNFNAILNVLVDIIEEAALPAQELADFKKYNLEFFPVFIQTKEKTCYRFLRSKESLKILVRYITAIDDALQKHIIIRSDNKEMAPSTISGKGFNVFYYSRGNSFDVYRFFYNQEQPISVGKVAYKCNATDENALLGVIKKAYDVSGCFELPESILLSNKYAYNGMEYIETPFFFVTSKCADINGASFQFSYKDWMTLDELKNVKKYSLKF